MTVIVIVRQCRDMGNELAVLAAINRGRHPHFDADLVGLWAYSCPSGGIRIAWGTNFIDVRRRLERASRASPPTPARVAFQVL
jgi:hypothetical protein